MTIRKTPTGIMASGRLHDGQGLIVVAGFGPTIPDAIREYQTTCILFHLPRI